MGHVCLNFFYIKCGPSKGLIIPCPLNFPPIHTQYNYILSKIGDMDYKYN